MKVIYTNDKNLETYGFLMKVIRVFSVPLLNSLPSSLIKRIMSISSNDASLIMNNAGSAHALEIMYTRHERNLFDRGFLVGIGNLFWDHYISHPKGLRNRLKIVQSYLREEILDNIKNKKSKLEVRILTVGGGSGRAVVQIVHEIIDKNGAIKLKVTSLDKSLSAIELGKKLSKEFHVYDKFDWINDRASNIKNLIPLNSIDIVEMVGLLDYFSEGKSIEVIRQIYNVLKLEGLFIVGNIYPNREELFIHKMGWPNMYYRTQNELVSILEKSGFSKEVEVIFEPLKNHIIGIVRK